jgi:uncharacterized repeat protein (TIGR03847 family)
MEAEAIGVPGQRTFRLRITSGQRTASLWLEKEQLQALALGLMRLLVQMGRPEDIGTAGAVADPLSPFPDQPSLEFKVGRLGLGFDQADESIVFFAYDVESEEEPEQTEAVLAYRASPDQCRDLLAMIEGIMAAGRPICRFCLAPIDPGGHVCARSNGHRPEGGLEEMP